MDKPLLSICIPTYNGEKFLAELFSSIEKLQESALNFEVIIADHSSSDSTMEIVSGFVQKFPKTTLVTTPRTDSIGTNWLSGIKQANGEFLKIVGQDDLLISHGVLAEVSYLQNNPCFIGVSSKRELIDERSWVIPIPQRKFHKEVLSRDHLINLCASFGTNPLSEPCAVVLRTESLQSVSSLDSSYAIDLHMYWLALQHGPIQTLESTSARFRISAGSWTSSVRRTTHREFLTFLREHSSEELPREWLVGLKSWVIGLGRRSVLGSAFLLVKVKKKISRSSDLNFKNSRDVGTQDCKHET